MANPYIFPLPSAGLQLFTKSPFMATGLLQEGQPGLETVMPKDWFLTRTHSLKNGSSGRSRVLAVLEVVGTHRPAPLHGHRELYPGSVLLGPPGHGCSAFRSHQTCLCTREWHKAEPRASSAQRPGVTKPFQEQ